MTPAFRPTALAAALLAASCATWADPVVLNFEDLGAQALAAQAPIAVSTVSGFNFQGAWAYNYGMLQSADDPSPGPNNKSNGFLANRGRGVVTASDIVVSLETLALAAALSPASAYPNQFISAISFSVFTRSQEFTVTWADAKGQTQFKSFTPGNNLGLWSFANTTGDAIDPLDQVTTLTFSAGGALFGLDDLSITLTDAGNGGGGGNVPEPASYALVGLALLAAGSASRRRS